MEPNRTIMVMDHDTSVSVLLEEILLSEGYGVRRYNGSQFTIDAVAQLHPDGIIIDLGRTDPNTALALLQTIRQHPTLRGTGVLITSTDNRLLEEIGAPVRQLRCAAIAKPFDLCEFLRQVQRALAAVGEMSQCA